VCVGGDGEIVRAKETQEEKGLGGEKSAWERDQNEGTVPPGHRAPALLQQKKSEAKSGSLKVLTA